MNDQTDCTCSTCGDNQPSSCCGPAQDGLDNLPWVVGRLDTPAGAVPQVATKLSWADKLGAAMVRLGLRRMAYAVPPGLYAVGSATPDSPVFVSANYKLSFDRLRQALGGIDGWILVLDTKGINVWCAAGKGTFGTDEVVERIEAVALAGVVAHRRLIVPQLGAPGVSAHDVARRSGFRVRYGPVRAEDIPAFLDADGKATAAMRLVRFDLRDRLAVIPVEIVISAKYMLLLAAGMFLLAGMGAEGYSWQRAAAVGLRSVLLLLGGYLVGVVAAPVLLPWLPGRAFSAKGAWVGLALAVGVTVYWLGNPAVLPSPLSIVAWALILPAVASFLAMNFTGASTYTSLSGVKREMRFAVPAQAAAGAIGLGLWIGARFF